MTAMTFSVKNPPNPGRMIESLRQLGYDNYSAICDILDNSLDAEAQSVWINVGRAEGDFIISLADDGNGMDLETLDQALRLGSLTDRDEEADLGKYGMGLVTASLSIARRTTVFSRIAGGPVLVSVTDIDEIIGRNDFVKELREASRDELERFASCYPGKELPAHGTLVVLDKCDHVSNHNTSNFKDALRNRVAETYRYFLGAGRTASLNGEQVAAVDPLMLDDKETEVHEDIYPISITTLTGEQIEDQLRIRVAVLPQHSEAMERYRKINRTNQGYYLLRNMRQIAAGETFDLYEKHNEYNRIRIEIFFSGKLDPFMGVRFTKQDVDPVQQIRDRIREATVGQIRTIGERIKREKKANTPDSAAEGHDEATKIITSKSPLLIKPPAEIERRASPTKRDGEPKSPTKPHTDQTGERIGKKTRVGMRDLNVRFDRVSLGRGGAIFEWGLEGKTVVVSWNIDHPFYDHYVLKNAGDKDVITGIDFFVYSLASALLKMQSDDNIELLESVMSIVSTNMRVLLSP